MKLLYEQLEEITPGAGYKNFKRPLDKAYLLENKTLKIGFPRCYSYFSKNNWFIKNNKLYAKSIITNIVQCWKIIDKGD